MARVTRILTPPFRSGYEEKIGNWMKSEGIAYEYETYSYEYEEPLRKNRARCSSCGSSDLVRSGWYTPDFFLTTGTTIEAKGRFTAADRRKALAVRESHPKLDIKYMFMRNNKISRRSATTYTDWCEANNIDCVVGVELKEEWL